MFTGLTAPLRATRILLLADIHGNYPAIKAIGEELGISTFDYLLNCGDSLVYAPFANETLRWLLRHNCLSILGNTDKKVIDLLNGRPMIKPKKADKRIMYSSTAGELDTSGRSALLGFAVSETLILRPCPENPGDKELRLGIYHGSPADPEEFLFDTTPDSRFRELAAATSDDIIITGHSHTPYHKVVDGVHFINPGSAGRMFDGDPRACCAVLQIEGQSISVHHRRISYDIEEVVAALRHRQLPEIYAAMFLQGKKLN